MTAIRSSLLCAFLLLTACGKTVQAPIEVRNAWSPVAPPGASVIAVYAEVSARDADTLLSASTSVAETAQMHSTTEENGMMTMRPLEKLELKAGETARFEPGGMHWMLIGPHQALPADSQFPLTLHFAKAGDVTVTVNVRAAAN
jgi:copper(I)-binding protein